MERRGLQVVTLPDRVMFARMRNWRHSSERLPTSTEEMSGSAEYVRMRYMEDGSLSETQRLETMAKEALIGMTPRRRDRTWSPE